MKTFKMLSCNLNHVTLTLTHPLETITVLGKSQIKLLKLLTMFKSSTANLFGKFDHIDLWLKMCCTSRNNGACAISNINLNW